MSRRRWYTIGGAAVAALFFQVFVHYQYVHLAGGYVMRIDRLTGSSCYMPCVSTPAPTNAPPQPTASTGNNLWGGTSASQRGGTSILSGALDGQTSPAPQATSVSFTASDNSAIQIARTFGEAASYYERLHPDWEWTVITRYSNDYADYDTAAVDPKAGEAPERGYPIREVCYCTTHDLGYYYEVHLDSDRVFTILGNKTLEVRYRVRRSGP